MDRSGESFLRRWSRRKAEARPGEPAEPSDSSTRAPSEADASAAAGQSTRAAPDGAAPEGVDAKRTHADPDRPLTEDDFADVDFDALDFDSDYTRFLGKGVPDSIRNRALRKLWVSDPVLTRFDGLDDCCEDFTDAVWATSEIKTAWRVGRGFMSDEEVADWERLGRPDEPGNVPAPATGEAVETAALDTSNAAGAEPLPSAAASEPVASSSAGPAPVAPADPPVVNAQSSQAERGAPGCSPDDAVGPAARASKPA
jgi:hypothetical protein